MLKLFRPAPVIDPLPKEKVDKEYKKLRWQVFLGIFIGYAGYYLVRKNFSIAMPALEEMGVSNPSAMTREDWDRIRTALHNQRILGLDYYSCLRAPEDTRHA